MEKEPTISKSPEISQEKKEEIIKDVKDQILAGKIFLEYGDHGHFDSCGHHGKMFVQGENKVMIVVTNIPNSASEDPDYLPKGEAWKYVVIGDIEFSPEETQQLIKHIDHMLKLEFDGVTEINSINIKKEIEASRDVLTGKLDVKDAYRF
ncbi:MAG: hypothetical protein ABH884_01285 [Candidatus Komeilibacteria bacterium]